MAIQWDFDRSKLTAREAQLVEALIQIGGLAMGAATLRAGGAPLTRAVEEEAARVLRDALVRALPDLDLRWEWAEGPA